MTPRKMTAVEDSEPVEAVQEEAASTPEVDEVKVIAPDDLVVDEELLLAGVPCYVGRLKTREHLAIGRILTRSAQFVDWSALNFSADEGQNQSEAIQVMVTMVSHIPFAEEDVIKLFKSITYPKVVLTKEEFAIWYRAMDNPEVDELVNVIGIVIRQERDNWARIGRSLEVVLPKALTAVAKNAMGQVTNQGA
jgi:hypothetical protein